MYYICNVLNFRVYRRESNLVYKGKLFTRSWEALGEARPGQSSLWAGALRYRAWAQSWSSAALAARSVQEGFLQVEGHVASPFDLSRTLPVGDGVLVLCSLPGPPIVK